MKVILSQEMPELGQRGDIVDVARGYARNYLLPKKIAVAATASALRVAEQEKSLVDVRRRKEVRLAGEVAKKLRRLSITLVREVGEQEKLFGSVTAQDIADELKKEGIEVTKRHVELDEPIKALGVYSVPVKLHSEVTAKVKVWVVTS